MLKKLVALPILLLAWMSGRYDPVPVPTNAEPKLLTLAETKCPNYPKPKPKSARKLQVTGKLREEGFKPKPAYKKKAHLHLISRFGETIEMISFRDNIFESNLKAKQFKANFIVQRACHLTQITLTDHANRTIGRHFHNRVLERGDYVKVVYNINEEEAHKLVSSEPLWMGIPLWELESKRLYNIVQALKKGHWASGKKVLFSEPMAKALYSEYDRRHFTQSDIDSFILANSQWEARNR
jgi:hypothetical protein